MTPVLPDVFLLPYIYPVSDKSRYTGGWCSVSGLNMYPPALSPPQTLLRPYGGYSYRPTMFCFGCITARRWAVLWWNPPRVLAILGVTTQVSEPNKRFALNTALLKFLKVQRSAPSRPKIPDKYDHLLQAFQRLSTTSSQS